MVRNCFFTYPMWTNFPVAPKVGAKMVASNLCISSVHFDNFLDNFFFGFNNKPVTTPFRLLDSRDSNCFFNVSNAKVHCWRVQALPNKWRRTVLAGLVLQRRGSEGSLDQVDSKGRDTIDEQDDQPIGNPMSQSTQSAFVWLNFLMSSGVDVANRN